mgnify:CR=1 FL=1
MKQFYHKQQLVQLTLERMDALLRDIPFVSDTEVILEPRYDSTVYGDLKFTVHFEGDHQPVVLGIDIKARGERRFVTQFIQRRKQWDVPAEIVFVAPYISEDSVALLKENRCSYMDLSGNCFISAAPLFISVQGKPNQFPRQEYEKDYFGRRSTAASILLRTLLQEPYKLWKVQELSELTGKSMGTASNVKKFLSEHGWAEEEKTGFRLCNIDEMLRTWAGEYHKKEDRVIRCYCLDPVPEVERQISLWNQNRGAAALLGKFSAAARYAPTVRYNQVSVYVNSQDVNEFLFDMELKRVESGENVTIIIPHDETPCLYPQEIGGTLITSPEQTVLDLLSGTGRGTEAADGILEKKYLL